MEFIESLKDEQEFQGHIDLWFKEIQIMVFDQMQEHNNVIATFYLMVLKNCKPDTIKLPVGPMFDLPEGKERVSRAMKKLCQRRKVLALVFASEAWMAERHVDDKDEIDRINKEGVRNQPDRKECVIISKETQAGCEADFYELVTGGEKRSIGELLQSSKETEGRFSNLLYSPKFKN